MQIESGLFDHIVVQRNRRNVSEAAFTGTCAVRGPVMATVRSGKRPLKGFEGVRVGRASQGRMRGCLAGLPAGGPYTVELAVGAEALTIRGVWVGDVWLLGGQSNMQGCGLFPRPRLPVADDVRAFYMDDRWAPARDPIHNMWECVDPVHVDLCAGVRPTKPDPDWGVCPGPAFGHEMRRRTGVPQGMIACAHGGTSMTQWDPGRKAEGGKSLYGAMVRRLVRNGGRVAGLIWYQGCSDANETSAPHYTRRMKALVAAVRRDTRDKDLPVAIVQIARVIGWGTDAGIHWNSIQEQQRLLPQSVRRLVTVPAIDLPLDDAIHVGGRGQYVLGARLAQAMQALRGDRKAGPSPIALKRISVETVRGLGVVVAEFDHVAGRLRSGDRPEGFFIASPKGNCKPFDIKLDGKTARVRSGLSAGDLGEAALHYGYGTDPYCNITDEGGRSLPVFGPVRIGVPRARTPFVRSLRVSAFQPSAGKLEGLDCPSSLDALGLTARVFGENFCNLHPEIGARGGQDEVVYYACKFACGEAMPLALVLGYDGPVKAWVDGRLLTHDPAGTNPATPEKRVTPFHVTAGEHEIVVALGTNRGAAWGIFLRLERRGVPKRQLLKGPPAYALPEMRG